MSRHHYFCTVLSKNVMDEVCNKKSIDLQAMPSTTVKTIHLRPPSSSTHGIPSNDPCSSTYPLSSLNQIAHRLNLLSPDSTPSLYFICKPMSRSGLAILISMRPGTSLVPPTVPIQVPGTCKFDHLLRSFGTLGLPKKSLDTMAS